MYGKAKLHLFYLVDKYITKKIYPVADIRNKTYDEDSEHEVVLYAYTLDKTMAKVFDAWRDPRRFIHKVVNVDALVYSEFEKEYPNQKLIDHGLSRKTSNNGIIDIGGMYLTMPSAEARYILEYREQLLIEQLKMSLDKDVDLYAFLNSLTNDEDKYILREIYPLSLIHERDYPLDEYSLEDIYIDELSLFITYFGNTISSGGEIPCFGSSIEFRQKMN